MFIQSRRFGFAAQGVQWLHLRDSDTLQMLCRTGCIAPRWGARIERPRSINIAPLRGPDRSYRLVGVCSEQTITQQHTNTPLPFWSFFNRLL
jgi:hypothetical protein